MRVKRLAPPVDVEPPRSGEDANDCVACNTADEAYIWVSERWRVKAMDRPTGLPAVLVLECRSHFDLGDLPNLLAAELGVMTVRLERAIRSLDGVGRVHVNRWGDGAAHLHVWFLARPYGRLQLRGTFLSLWDDILPVVPEYQWQENLGLVAAWLAGFGGRAVAEPPHIAWQSPATVGEQTLEGTSPSDSRPQDLADVEAVSPRVVSPRREPADSEPHRATPEPTTVDRGAVTDDLSESTRRLPTPRTATPDEATTVRLRPPATGPTDAGSATVRLRPAGPGSTDTEPATVQLRPAVADEMTARDARPSDTRERPSTGRDPADDSAGSPG